MITPAEIIVMRLIPLVAGYEMSSFIRILMRVSCLGWFIYFYLGYLIGNGLLKITVSTSKILLMWVCSIVLQILEGYWYYLMGESNCGTQLKLTAILSGGLFTLFAYRYIKSERIPAPKIFHFTGNYSFGIFFSHLAVMAVLSHIPYYREIVRFPINGVIAIAVTSLCVIIGRKILGKYANYLALS